MWDFSIVVLWISKSKISVKLKGSLFGKIYAPQENNLFYTNNNISSFNAVV